MRLAEPLSALRRFAAEAPASVSRCDGCASPLGPSHAHRYDPSRRRVECVCVRCAQPRPPWRVVPPRLEVVEDLGPAAEAWMSENVPVRLAFFVAHDDGEGTASFPGPAGPTVSTIDRAEWASLQGHVPRLRALSAEVEALLVNRVDGARDTFIVSIDVCYHLVGLLRGRRWGHRLGREAEELFADLRREVANG